MTTYYLRTHISPAIVPSYLTAPPFSAHVADDADADINLPCSLLFFPSGSTSRYGTCRPLTDNEKTRYRHAVDDGRVTGRKPLAAPGSADPMKGPDMLAWRPEVRIASFVPHGKLAQENRFARGTSRAMTACDRTSATGQMHGGSMQRGTHSR